MNGVKQKKAKEEEAIDFQIQHKVSIAISI